MIDRPHSSDPVALAEQAVRDALARDAFVQARIDSMPAQLRAFPHWGFYRADKAPRSATGIKFSINDPASWAAYDTLRTARLPDGVVGPTFVLTDALNLTVIDLDDPERAYARDDLDITPERRQFLIDAANEWIRRILIWAIAAGAWIERSNSGKGWHILVFGPAPEAKYAIGLVGHIYRVGHVHMTGDLHPQSASIIPHAQPALDELIAFALSRDLIRPIVGSDGNDAPVREGNGRRLDLTDAQCIETLNSLGRKLLDGPGQGNWSDETYRLILDLDKITGDPVQVHRILFASKRIRSAGTAANGRDRYERTDEQFGVMLAKARAKNDKRSALYECIDGVWQLRTGGITFDAASVKPRKQEPNP